MSSRIKYIFKKVMVGSILAIVMLMQAPHTAQAATPGSLYSYDFTGATLASPITNEAAANSNVNLKLYGAWSQSAFGIHFAGDQSGQQSVAYTRPSSGYTLSVAGNQAFGSAIKFKHEAPTNGSCFSDSQNLTQIGRFGTGLSQVKMQLSGCNINNSQVFVQCRMAGSNSSTNDVPLTSAQPLVDGEAYAVKCIKSPDPSVGTTTMQLTVTRLSDSHTTNDTFAITRTGAMQSTAYLSVANKYALPSPYANSDQFVGDVAKVAYCAGDTTSNVDDCLITEIPASTTTEPEPELEPEPTIREYIDNPGLETDLTGWTGVYNRTSKNTRVAGGYEGSYSLRSVNNTSSTGANGFISKPSWIDGSNNATRAGQEYIGSAWVKPDVAGQKIHIYLRERNANGTTVGSKTVAVTTTTTDWVRIVNPYTAKHTGNSLGFYVYATHVGSYKGFNADAFSLTTQN